MNKTDALTLILDIARAGRGLTPVDALAHVADLIERADTTDPSHDTNVEMLLRLGACIWVMRNAALNLPRA